jgi:citrate lyase subunit beta/citryl-CoA lyase
MSQLRRSALFTPADQPEMMRKAAETGADAFVFDLEDAVPADHLDDARAALRDVVPDVREPNREVSVRINALDTAWWHEDLAAALDAGVDAVVVPKLADPEMVPRLDGALTSSGTVSERPTVRLVTESPTGLQAAADTANRAGRIDYVRSLSFGLADYQRTIGAPAVSDQLREHLAFRVRNAAVANGLESFGSTHLDVEDEAKLRATAEQYRAFGYPGMSAIHPKQVPVINDVFTPATERVDRARRLLEAYEDADENSLLVDGVFLDEATVGQCRGLVERYDAIRSVDR